MPFFGGTLYSMLCLDTASQQLRTREREREREREKIMDVCGPIYV